MLKIAQTNTKNIVIKKLSAWSKFEISSFLIAITIVLFCSIYMQDSPTAVISAICGIIYTILAGKGKVYCYFFGIIGTLCCAYLSYDIALYGNFALHLLYYFPMEIIGFFTWKKHIDKTTNEIIKEKLSRKELSTMIVIITLATMFTYLFFVHINDKSPLLDASMTVLSIAGMILTVRRSIEQWVVWTFVNLLSIIIWFNAFTAGEKIFSIFVVRIIYFFLGIYFFIKWRKSSLEQQNTIIKSDRIVH